MLRSVEGCHHRSIMILIGEYAELGSRLGKGPKGKAWLMDGPAWEAAGAARNGEASAKPPAVLG
jgi:hypothetical protein